MGCFAMVAIMAVVYCTIIKYLSQNSCLLILTQELMYLIITYNISYINSTILSYQTIL